MQADLAMTAGPGLSEAANLVITLPRSLLLRGIVELVNEIRQQAHIAFLPQQNAIGGLPIASRAAGLLVVLLNGFRQR